MNDVPNSITDNGAPANLSIGKPIAARAASGFTATRFKKITQVGIKSIYSHGLRSLLTVLGIVIGVAAVIAMLAVSEGASFEAQRQFRDLGASNILLKSVKPAEVEQSSSQGFGPPQAIIYGLTLADITTIRESIPGINNVIPSRIVKKNLWNGGNQMNSDVVGTAVDYPVSRNYNLRAGRFFSESEVRDNANVIVLSDEVARGLFPIDNPLGQSVRIDSDYYNIVGIMEAEGYSNLGQNQAGSSNAAPSRVFIPFTSSKSRFGETTTRQTAGGTESETVELHEAIIQVDSQELVIQVGEVIDSILARRHKDVDYAIEVPLALLRQAEESALRDQIVAGGNSRDFIARRWHWYYEYHACERDRTNAGDWYSPRTRGEEARHHSAVSNRGGHLVGCGRINWRRAGHYHSLYYFGGMGHDNDRYPAGTDSCLHDLGLDRRCFRHLSVNASCRHGSSGGTKA